MKYTPVFLSRLVDVSLISLGTFFLQQANAAGIDNQNNINVTANDRDTIVADTRDSAGNLYGVRIPSGSNAGKVDLGNNVVVSVIDPTSFATGIHIQADNSILSANQLTVNVAGDRALGLELSGSGVYADLGTGSTIKSTSNGTVGRAAQGVIVRNNSTLLADHVSIETSGDDGIGLSISDYGSSADLGSGSYIKTNGTGSHGVYVGGLNGNPANGAAYFTATGLTIDAQGYSAYGMNVQNNSVVDLGTGSVIRSNGEYAHGIWSFGNITANALTINATGNNANGIEVRGGTTNIGADSHISSAQGGGLVASGANATINYLGTTTERNSLYSGGSYGASSQSATAVINMQNTDITVDRNGRLALGLWALNGGVIKGENLSITGAAGTRGVYAMTGSQIELTNGLIVNMDTPDQMAIATQHNEGYAASQINASGLMHINGSVLATGGKINLDMSSGSTWTGYSLSDNVNEGKLDVAMNNSVWHVTSDSNIDKLTLANSTVDFVSRASSANAFTTLNVVNLSGNSNMVMQADIVGEGDGVNNAGDLLNVSGSSSGHHVLSILNQGSQATTGNEVLTVVQTTDGVASFTASSQVELGGYLYDLRKNGTNWALYSSGSAPSTTADAGGNYLNVGYLMNYEENRSLLQRMGDLRNGNKEGNIWLRGYGGKFDSFASGRLSSFEMDYSGLQFGGDKRISEEMPLYVGMFIGSTHASPDYRRGDGTARSDYWGMYANYVAQSGFYSDLVVKASSQRNHFNVLDSQNNSVTASGRSSGHSVSLEAGQKLNPYPALTGFYIEPQTQLTYSRQDDMRMKASNGLNINLSHYESILGRVSVVLGYEVTTSKNQINMYLKTGAIREFSGDTDYSLNGSREDHSFKGNGWNNGVGLSANLNKQHTIYLEADYTRANAFDQKQLSGGYRFSF